MRMEETILVTCSAFAYAKEGNNMPEILGHWF
jgi:hypothetical protein